MKDIFNDYKRERTKKNIAIIAASFVFALWFNAFIFGTNVWTQIQTSVLNSTWKEIKKMGDIEIINAWTGTDMLKLITHNRFDKASWITLSLVFNPETLEIDDIFSSNKDREIIKNSNVPGILSLTILFKEPITLKENDEIFTLVYKKKKSEKVVINIAETQFKNKDNIVYELSSTPIEF